MHCSLLSLGCVFGFAVTEKQATLTALRAFKIAQRRLKPEVRANLLSASSARMDVTLVPTAWRFVFLDTATSGHCRVVTVAAKTSSEHPDTVEAFSSAKVEDVLTLHPVAQDKLLIDSGEVLEHARALTKLKHLQAVEYRLAQPHTGSDPLWEVHFYTEEQAPVATFQVNARTGEAALASKAS